MKIITFIATVVLSIPLNTFYLLGSASAAPSTDVVIAQVDHGSGLTGGARQEVTALFNSSSSDMMSVVGVSNIVRPQTSMASRGHTALR